MEGRKDGWREGEMEGGTSDLSPTYYRCSNQVVAKVFDCRPGSIPLVALQVTKFVFFF